MRALIFRLKSLNFVLKVTEGLLRILIRDIILSDLNFMNVTL